MTCKTSQNLTKHVPWLTWQSEKRETLTATPVAPSSGGRYGCSLICNRRQALQRVELRHCCCCWRVYSLTVSPSLCLCVCLSLASWWSGRGTWLQQKEEEERWVSSLTLESVLLAYPWRNPRIFAESLVNKNLCCWCCGGLYLSLLLLQSVCCCGDCFFGIVWKWTI